MPSCPCLARPARRRNRAVALVLALLCAAATLAACGAATVAQAPATPRQANATTPPQAALAPPTALHVEGVPPLDAALLPALRRYSEVAGHQFVDWHPLLREMLVAHRAAGQSTTQLYRLRRPLGALEPLTDGADPVTTARWEPRRGRFILFERASRGDEAYQIYRLDPETADTRAAVPIMPNGERHGLAGFIESKGLALILSVPLDRTAAGSGSRTRPLTTRLTAVDPLAPHVPAGRRVIADLPGTGWFGAEVSPDETQIALTRYFAATHSEAWVVDVASGAARRVLPAAADTATRAAHFVAGWTDDGRGLYTVSDRAGEFRELMQIDLAGDLAGGQLTRLTPHIAWDVNEGDLGMAGAPLAMVANVDGRDELRLIERDAARAGRRERTLPAWPSLAGSSVGRVRFHRASGELALVTSSARGPGQVWSLDVASGRHEAWTQVSVPAGLDLSQAPEQQIVRWKSFDGRTISGVLSLPPARFTGRRPVLLAMHGGPEAQAKLGWNGRLNYLLLERGVAILEPNVRGSSGYGKTFVDLDNGRAREDSVKDMSGAIDWAATHPRLDGGKVVVSGGSYGGYMALAAATRLSDRIAGAASSVGISNFVTFLERTESYRRDLRRAEYGDERDPAMREFLLSISPLTHADKVSKPLLVMQGRNDPRVPWTESEQIVRRLQQRGVPVWYLLADNEGHGFARRENADFALATLVRFLEETVLR
ncbi:MAG: S9 family peptidase [Burkholderiales bacterium]|nr:S9 family peptidase [Burkholderiales bacterium]